jgi:hypothetical protein
MLMGAPNIGSFPDKDRLQEHHSELMNAFHNALVCRGFVGQFPS